MIKSEYGTTAIRGDEAEIMTDATCILRALRKALAKKHGVEGADDRIQDIIMKSKMSDDEISIEFFERLIKMIGGLPDSDSKN